MKPLLCKGKEGLALFSSNPGIMGKMRPTKVGCILHIILGPLPQAKRRALRFCARCILGKGGGLTLREEAPGLRSKPYPRQWAPPLSPTPSKGPLKVGCILHIILGPLPQAKVPLFFKPWDSLKKNPTGRKMRLVKGGG